MSATCARPGPWGCTMASAPLLEVFCSVQGEGPFLGVRQVFLRFAGCNLACDYCDTAVKPEPHCRVERIPGSGEEELLKNPLSAELLKELVESYGKVHSVALTGGEPLLHADLIRALDVAVPLYLESNMTLPEEAAKLRRRLSFVAGDFKVREVLHGSRRSYEEVREATIASFRVLRSTRRRYTFCKLILPSRFNAEEVLTNVEAVARYINMAVLQPVWQCPPPGQELLALQAELLDIVETRIIPQTHKVLAMR